jgi:hypothetical protein
MRFAAAAALLVVAGCAAPPSDEPTSRNLKRGLFYETFRPESSRREELKRKLDRPVAPEIDETYDIGKIRAVRQYSESPENYDLRDWKDGVLLRADADLLRRMREDTAAKVGALETQLAGMSREPEPISKGRIEPVRNRLSVEKTKLEAIDDRLARVQ